jgi:hypothetical protein
VSESFVEVGVSEEIYVAAVEAALREKEKTG